MGILISILGRTDFRKEDSITLISGAFVLEELDEKEFVEAMTEKCFAFPVKIG